MNAQLEMPKNFTTGTYAVTYSRIDEAHIVEAISQGAGGTHYYPMYSTGSNLIPYAYYRVGKNGQKSFKTEAGARKFIALAMK